MTADLEKGNIPLGERMRMYEQSAHETHIERAAENLTAPRRLPEDTQHLQSNIAPPQHEDAPSDKNSRQAFSKGLEVFSSPAAGRRRSSEVPEKEASAMRGIYTKAKDVFESPSNGRRVSTNNGQSVDAPAETKQVFSKAKDVFESNNAVELTNPHRRPSESVGNNEKVPIHERMANFTVADRMEQNGYQQPVAPPRRKSSYRDKVELRHVQQPQETSPRASTVPAWPPAEQQSSKGSAATSPQPQRKASETGKFISYAAAVSSNPTSRKNSTLGEDGKPFGSPIKSARDPVHETAVREYAGSKEAQAIVKAILDGDKTISWAIFRFDRLFTLETFGCGDFDRFRDSFSDDSVLYGYLRIPFGVEKRNKFVFIRWVGEEVKPMLRARAFEGSKKAMEIIKVYHLDVPSSKKVELTESGILERLTNAAGANYDKEQNSASHVAKNVTGSEFHSYKLTSKQFFENIEKNGNVKYVYDSKPLAKNTPVNLGVRPLSTIGPQKIMRRRSSRRRTSKY